MMLAGVTRRPAFWAAYALLAVLALAAAWKLFPQAIPLVNLDVTMSRAEALARAEAISAKLHLAPEGARSAVRFGHDETMQNYVELEAGGKPAFAALVASDVYSPYFWDVRLFKPGAIEEATIRFRPDGRVYGFSAKVPETWMPDNVARAALESEAARALAEAAARDDWAADLSEYKLLERTQQKRANGRVDHAFVYQRESGNLGESHFRVALNVAGDRLIALKYFVDIPESFERQFVELRSANNTIAGVAALLAGVLYGLGGCVLGVLWLLRRHWLLWRPALIAGLTVGALMGAMALASTPAAWFGFDTAQSADVFWVRQIGTAIVIVVGGGFGYALVFMAAESLSRRAFGAHPQLWRVWSPAAGPSKEVLGRTLGGYLFVPLELALILAFYYASNRWFGWWQPSEALTDPNILGSAVPALTPIAVSLQAGFMEESLFRAVPLSLAAIVGERFGRRNLAIGIAVVLQALIFGGAHANYPGFPAYSRLVELIVPSIMWALIFLRFGLVPTVLLHALFDLCLFAVPIFLVDAPGGTLQRLLVIAAALVPLGIVLARRMLAGRWRDLPTDLRNGAWQPEARAAVPVAGPATAAIVGGWTALYQRALPLLGVIGLALWVAFTPFHADVPALRQSRSEAIAAAEEVLKSRGVVPGPEWRRAAMPKLSAEDSGQKLWHQFVWRVAGPDVYRALIGKALAPPLWEVRFAKSDGDVAERAEEWNVTLDPTGAPRVVRHALPEGRAGAKLSQDAARALAERELETRFGVATGALKEIGADEKQRPARTDWTFTYTDPRVAIGEGGEARFLVSLAGDEVAASGRYIHVPEQWLRTEREREGQLLVVKLALAGLFALIGLAAIVAAVMEWNKGHVDRRALIGVAAISFVSTVLGLVNRWPQIAMNLNTAEPIGTQIGITVLGALFGGVVLALLGGLIAGVGLWSGARRPMAVLATRLPPWLAGAAAVLFTTGLTTAIDRLVPAAMPLWPSHAYAAAASPALAALLSGVQAMLSVLLALFVLQWLARMSGEFARRSWLVLAFLVLAAAGGAMARGAGPAASIATGVIEGALAYAAVYALLRFDVRTIPAFVAGGAILHAIETAALIATTNAWIDAALASVATAAAAWGVNRYLRRVRSISAPSPIAE